MEKTYSEGCQILELICQRSCEISLCADTQLFKALNNLLRKLGWSRASKEWIIQAWHISSFSSVSLEAVGTPALRGPVWQDGHVVDVR